MNILSCECRHNEIVVSLDEKVKPRKFVKFLTPILQDMLHDSDIKATNISEHFKHKNAKGFVYYGFGTNSLKPYFILPANREKRSNEFLLEEYEMRMGDYEKLIGKLNDAFSNYQKPN
jgi:hypothetical protein